MSHSPHDYALTLLDVPVHPALARLFGYEGGRRFAAFHWEPAGDEILYDDGIVSGDGDWSAWLLWTRHEAVWEHLLGWDFGSSDHKGRDALVIDRMARVCYAGPRESARFFLLGAPDLIAEREAYANLSEEEQRERELEALEALEAARRELRRIERSREDPEALEAYVQERMQKQQEELKRLEAWLDEQVEQS